MSTATTATPDDVEVPDDALKESYTHHSDWVYLRIALILAVLTALEVSTYYIDFGPLFLPVLMVLMVLKFGLVALYFMHLKFDAKIFGRLFWAGLILAVAVYVVALASFQFFTS